MYSCYCANILQCTICLLLCTTVKRVASAGKENLPCSSTEVLQPVSMNSSSGLLQRQTPLLAPGSTPVAVSAKERSGRFSRSFNDPLQTTLKRYTHTPPHPAAISSGTLSTMHLCCMSADFNCANVNPNKQYLLL